jgi:hypothetical protein
MPTLLRLDCRLDSLSHRTICGITADRSDLYTAHRWAVATLMSSYIFIVASMPLPHSCGIMLIWKQYETIQGLSCGITADFDCGIMPTLLRLADCRLDSSSHRTTCGITANLSDLYSGIDATSTLLWNYAAMKAVCDHTRSFLRHHCRLSLIFIVASLPLPHYCGNVLLRKQYETKLVSVGASLPTCG